MKHETPIVPPTIIIYNKEYKLTPVEPELYTIERIKAEKIAVIVKDWSEVSKLCDPSKFNYLKNYHFPVLIIWDTTFAAEDWTWLKPDESEQTRNFLKKYDYKIVPISAVAFPVKEEKVNEAVKEWEVSERRSETNVYKFISGRWYLSNEGGEFPICVELAQNIESKFPIHSVLRLTDSTEWSIGDEVKDLGNPDFKKIAKFEIEDTLMDGKKPYALDETGMYKCPIERLSKPAKKPLFISFDEYEILDGDKVFVVSSDFGLTDMTAQFKFKEGLAKSGKVFKHQVNALSYISKHKPKYSEQQLMDAMNIAAEDLDKFEISDPIEIIQIKLGIVARTSSSTSPTNGSANDLSNHK